MDGKSQLHGKTDRTQHADRIFAVALFGIPDQPHQAGAVIFHAADKIDDGKIIDVVVKRIDRKITPKRIFFNRAVDIVPENAPILEDPIALRLLGLQGAKSGNLDDFLTKVHMGQPKAATDQTTVAEHRTHLLGMRIRDNVKILGLPTQKQIANATAYQISLKTGFFESVQHFQRIFADLRALNIVLRSTVDPGHAIPVIHRRRLDQRRRRYQLFYESKNGQRISGSGVKGKRGEYYPTGQALAKKCPVKANPL